MIKFIENLLKSPPQFDGEIIDYKPLGEVCELKRGQSLSKKNSQIGDIPVVSGGKEPAFYTNQFNRDGETITVAGSGSAGYVMFWNKPIFVADAFSIKPKSDINLKYIYYFLANMQNDIYRLQTIGGVPHVYPKDVAKIVIPIPPIRVQTEIVRILDEYTEKHEALKLELSAELELRKKQYYYYREKLLTFTNDTAEFLPLGEVGEIIRGKDIQKKHLLSEGVAAIHYGQIYTHYGVYTDKSKSFVSEDFVKYNKLRLAPSGSLIVATTSENDEDLCKAVAWLGSDEVAISGDACFVISQLNSKFLSYFFCTDNFREQKKKFISGTKVRRVNASDLAKIIIPIPPIAEQERIVAILDKFDILVNSISEGIPAEINLRQKQYEYYRNALLSFN